MEATNESMNRKALQAMMNEAYGIWENSPKFSWTYEEFLEAVQEKFGDRYVQAVACGNLNYQVENGGFYQWLVNGYDASAHHVRALCEKMNTPKSLEVAHLVQLALDANDEGLTEDEGCGELDTTWATLGKLDREFDSVHNAWIEEVAVFLTKE